MATDAEILTAHASLSRAIAAERDAKAKLLAAQKAADDAMAASGLASRDVEAKQAAVKALAGQTMAEPAPTPAPVKPALPQGGSGTAPPKPAKFARG